MKLFKRYSDFYDILYEDKDYPGEVQYVEKLVSSYSSKPVEIVLSLGCGTCNHELILAQKYNIIGVDNSRKMLEIAKGKINKSNLDKNISLNHSDIRNFDLDRKADLAIALFNVVGYLTKNEDVVSFLKKTNKHLQSGSLLIFDCWYLPAVLRDPPYSRKKVIKSSPNIRVIRYSQPLMHYKQNTFDIEFQVLEIEGDSIVTEVNETHTIRYWSLPELSLLLQDNNFELKKALTFSSLEKEPSVNDWNMTIIAQKM